MQTQPQIMPSFNVNMFKEIYLRTELHQVKMPQLSNPFFIYDQSASSNQNIQKVQLDESINEQPDSTLQNQPISKFLSKSTPTTKIPYNQKYKSHLITRPTQTETKLKPIKKGKQTSKKDYKKNICGYITRKVVKQSLGPDYQQNIKELCIELGIKTNDFYLIYRSRTFQNITGPTHFYNLVSPKLDYEDLNDNLVQISARMVFVIFFQWFLRNRYIRYLMHDGKMSQKDKYIGYKNRELLNLIAWEWNDVLKKVENELKNGVVTVKKVMDSLPMIYEQIVERNRVEKISQSKEVEYLQRTAQKQN